jgi:hypothetical protein
MPLLREKFRKVGKRMMRVLRKLRKEGKWQSKIYIRRSRCNPKQKTGSTSFRRNHKGKKRKGCMRSNKE